MRHGQDEVVRALVHKGVNLDIRMCGGGRMTPVGNAVIEDRMSTLPVLLAGGADVNICDQVLGHAALHLEARSATKLGPFQRSLRPGPTSKPGL